MPALFPSDSDRTGRAVPTLWDMAGRAQPMPVALPAARVGMPARADAGEAGFIVLASSSAGNCSALIVGRGRLRRVTLIDAGLPPRRTFRCLASLGLGPEHVDRVLFTHLDRDHAHAGWVRSLPRHAEFFVHARHRSRGERMGLLVRRTTIFQDPFELAGGMAVHPALAAHDDLGVVAFRIEIRAPGDGERVRTIGYATDLGRVPDHLIDALHGVGVLAIESNYCPMMQAASDRPAFLKDRIMGGSGHLSNEQCAAAVLAIAPERSVVLLHLSRECNTPERAAAGHGCAGYELSISDCTSPTPMIAV